jgi:hypothetical protein
VNIKIAGKWMFIPLKMVLIGIDPYPYLLIHNSIVQQFIAWGPPEQLRPAKSEYS